MRKLVAFAQALAGIAFLGFGVLLVVFPFPRAGWDVVLGAFGMGLTLILWPVFSAREHRHREGVKRSLWAAGFEEDPARDGRARVLHLDRVAPGCSMKVRLAARGCLEGLRVHVAEYVLPGLGDIVPEQTGFEVAVQVRGPRTSLALTTSLGFMGRPLGQLFEKPAPALGDVEFSKRWELTCDHMRAAAELLRPELRAWLVEAPGLEAAWVLADGWLSCTWTSEFNQPALREMVTRLEQFVRLSGIEVVECDEPS